MTTTTELVTLAANKRAALNGLTEALTNDPAATYRRIGDLPAFTTLARGHLFTVTVDTTASRAWAIGRDGARWELGRADTRQAVACLDRAIRRTAYRWGA